MAQAGPTGEKIFRGIPVSAGVCRGKILVLDRPRPTISRREIPAFHIPESDLLVSIGADLVETFLNPVEFAMDLAAARERPERPSHRSNHTWSRRTAGSKPVRSSAEPWPHGNWLDERPTCRADPRTSHRGSSSRRGKRSRRGNRANADADRGSRRHCTRATHARQRTTRRRHHHSHCDDQMPSRPPDSSWPSSTRHCTFNQPPAKMEWKHPHVPPHTPETLS